jgi:peptidoglycan/xylan/chitin deacetylase (PgdA/CDA1 family)
MTHARWISLGLPFIAAPLMVLGCSSAGSGDDSGDGSDPSQEEIEAWNNAYEENASGKADSAGCSGVVVPDRGGFNKHIALTFDDGPSLENTPKVLDILARHGAIGTFFINGKNVRTQAHRDLLVQMAAAGHNIGNHSQNHANLAQVSASQLRAEIEQTHQILVNLNLHPRFFRFPFGSSTCSTAETVRSYGYAVTGWHIDSADWCYGAPAGGVGYCAKSTFKYVPDEYRSDMAGYVLSQAKSVGGGVLLFHDIHGYTVSQLDNILTKLEQNGFKFVSLSDATTFPKLNGTSAPQPAWVGTPCKANETCNFSASGEKGYCHMFEDEAGEPQGFCSLACAGYCPDRSGAAPTFCVSLDGGSTGECVSKASDANHQCTDLPGTSATRADRYLGSSTAPPATATVCMPPMAQ